MNGPSSEPNTLGDAVRTLRSERGLTVTQLAGLAGESKAYISQLEHSRIQNPGYEHLANIARALDVPVTHLLLEQQPIDAQPPLATDDRILPRDRGSRNPEAPIGSTPDQGAEASRALAEILTRLEETTELIRRYLSTTDPNGPAGALRAVVEPEAADVRVVAKHSRPTAASSDLKVERGSIGVPRQFILIDRQGKEAEVEVLTIARRLQVRLLSGRVTFHTRAFGGTESGELSSAWTRLQADLGDDVVEKLAETLRVE